MRMEQITDSISFHGEGPVWWEQTKEIRFLDMLSGDVLAVDKSGNHRRLPVGAEVVACIRPRKNGGAIVARTRDVALCENEDLSDLKTITGDFIDASKRFNEGGCDPHGRFYIGNMSWQKKIGTSQMYRISPGADSPEPVLDGLTTSNGIAFSPDGTLAYYNDTETMVTSVFDYTFEGGLQNRRDFARYRDGEGRPDGLCVDAEGGVWIAMHRAGHIRRYDPEGRLSERIDLPVTMATAVGFGGNDLSILFVTTSRNDVANGDEPAAGALFAEKIGVKGLEPLPFDG